MQRVLLQKLIERYCAYCWPRRFIMVVRRVIIGPYPTSAECNSRFHVLRLSDTFPSLLRYLFITVPWIKYCTNLLCPLCVLHVLRFLNYISVSIDFVGGISWHCQVRHVHVRRFIMQSDSLPVSVQNDTFQYTSTWCLRVVLNYFLKIVWSEWFLYNGSLEIVFIPWMWSFGLSEYFQYFWAFNILQKF